MNCQTCTNLETELTKRRITKDDYLKKLSYHQHEEKIGEYRKELGTFSNQLSELIKDKETIASEVATLEKQKAVLVSELTAASQEVIRLDKIMVTHDSRLAAVNKEINEKLNLSVSWLTEYNGRVLELSGRIDTLSSKVDELQSIKQQLEPLKEERETILRDISIAQSKKIAIEQDIAKQYDDLSNKKEDLSQLIEKHGKILTQTEENLAKIELYARRLQRYYDETGINLQILPIFGITN